MLRGKGGRFLQHCINKEDFVYKIGGTVNGGSNGIYFEEGYEILDSTYWDEEDGVILELEGIVSKKDNYWSAEVLIGDVKVVNKYTKSQFFRKYKE